MDAQKECNLGVGGGGGGGKQVRRQNLKSLVAVLLVEVIFLFFLTQF